MFEDNTILFIILIIAIAIVAFLLTYTKSESSIIEKTSLSDGWEEFVSKPKNKPPSPPPPPPEFGPSGYVPTPDPRSRGAPQQVVEQNYYERDNISQD